MILNNINFKNCVFYDYKSNYYTYEDVEFIEGFFFSKDNQNKIIKILYKKNEN